MGGQLEERLRKVNYNVAPDNQYRDSVSWGRAALDWKLGSSWSAKTQMYYYRADRAWKNFPEPRANAGTNPLTVSIREVEALSYDNSQPGFRQAFNTAGKLASFGYRFAIGGELNQSDFESPRFQAGPTNITVDAFQPGERSFNAFVGNPDRLRAAKVTTAALFTEASLDLTSTVRAFAGYRFDDLRVRTRFENPTGGLQTAARDYTANNVRFGVTYAFHPTSTVYAAYATGKEPVDNSAFAFISPADLRNTKLTRARQFQVGSKHQFASGRAELTTALYDIKRNDVLTVDPNLGGGTRFQIGEQKSYGFEIAGAVRPTNYLSFSATSRSSMPNTVTTFRRQPD